MKSKYLCTEFGDKVLTDWYKNIKGKEENFFRILCKATSQYQIKQFKKN